jgi:hypothetical protein
MERGDGRNRQCGRKGSWELEERKGENNGAYFVLAVRSRLRTM